MDLNYIFGSTLIVGGRTGSDLDPCVLAVTWTEAQCRVDVICARIKKRLSSIHPGCVPLLLIEIIFNEITITRVNWPERPVQLNARKTCLWRVI